MANNLLLLTGWLTKQEVAHNVILCRGSASSGGDDSEWGRVVVWARRKVVGAKDPSQFAMAVCELSGQVRISPGPRI